MSFFLKFDLQPARPAKQWLVKWQLKGCIQTRNAFKCFWYFVFVHFLKICLFEAQLEFSKFLADLVKARKGDLVGHPSQSNREQKIWISHKKPEFGMRMSHIILLCQTLLISGYLGTSMKISRILFSRKLSKFCLVGILGLWTQLRVNGSELREIWRIWFWWFLDLLSKQNIEVKHFWNIFLFNRWEFVFRGRNSLLFFRAFGQLWSAATSNLGRWRHVPHRLHTSIYLIGVSRMTFHALFQQLHKRLVVCCLSLRFDLHLTNWSSTCRTRFYVSVIVHVYPRVSMCIGSQRGIRGIGQSYHYAKCNHASSLCICLNYVFSCTFCIILIRIDLCLC